ncbi:MAG: uracil-DNA glycosylase family protein [Candidatus Methylomirabilales bacterium]
MSTGIESSAPRLEEWRRLQQDIAQCQECSSRWPGEVTRPLSLGEIPDPPQVVDILFVGVAPTPEEGPHRGTHFYSSPRDLLRLGLFRLLAEAEFGLPLLGVELEEGNRRFHAEGLFFVHAAKVRPVRNPAPPFDAIGFCALRHLRREIPVLNPRAVCFLGKNNASVAAEALFGRAIGKAESVQLVGWSGLGVVADQPRRQWKPRTRAVIRQLWRVRERLSGGDS